jgi:hypothetical protein
MEKTLSGSRSTVTAASARMDRASSSGYGCTYTTLRIPALSIAFVQKEQGSWVQYIAAPAVLVPTEAAWAMAFISAWDPRQISWRSPEGIPSFVLRQPTSPQ